MITTGNPIEPVGNSFMFTRDLLEILEALARILPENNYSYPII